MKFKNLLFVLMLSALLFACSDDSTDPTADDIPTVKIGDQVWMLKNLDVDHYRNGDPIPQVTDSTEWTQLTTGAWCYYDNDSENGETYGRLYNWYAVNDPRGLAPEGWHVATYGEWMTLTVYLGVPQSEADTTERWCGTDQGSQIAGREDLWIDGLLDSNPNFGTSGFTGLPSGYRYSHARFLHKGDWTLWWTTSAFDDTTAWTHCLWNDTTLIARFWENKKIGFPVRCVKD